MRNRIGMTLLAVGACSASALAQVGVNQGDLPLGISESAASETFKLFRGGAQIRVGAGVQDGYWTSTAFLQTSELDNTGGLSHNARGNLLSQNFGTTTTGGTLYNLRTTPGGNTVQGPLFTHSAAATGELAAQRVGGISVSPDNTKIAGTTYDLGKLWVLDYNAGATPGTGAGASVSNYRKTATINSGLVTFGTTWIDNDTIATCVFNVNEPTLLTVDLVAGVLQPPVTRAVLPLFAAVGSSRFTDVEYQPAAAPYVFALYSQFEGSTANILSIIDPATWTVIRSITLYASLSTSREIAMGTDGHLYISQFANTAADAVYIDVLDLDLVAPFGVINIDDINALADESSQNHVRRIIGTYQDEGQAFTGLDFAFSAPIGVPTQPVVGACCTPDGCVAQVTEAHCIAARDGTRDTGLGGTYQGDNSSCAGCPGVNGACCAPDGSCSLVTFTACLAASGLYYGDGTLCGPNACTGPGACCFADGTCTSVTAKDCYTAGGYYNGIGSLCTPSPCLTVPPTVSAEVTFDEAALPSGRYTSLAVAPDNSASVPPGIFGTDAFDVFGVTTRTVNIDFADETQGALPQDVFGIIPVSRTDKFFGVEDLTNPLNLAGTGTATFTFDISTLTGLAVEVEIASLGNFEDANDIFSFTASIDGGPAQTLFASDVLEGTFVYAIMDRGTRVSAFPFGELLRDPLAFNGIQSRNEFIRFIAPVTGTGNTLVLTFNASGDGAAEVLAFDNIKIRSAVAGNPCPLDLSGNDLVDADDIFAFLNIWFDGPPGGTCTGCQADWNNDGDITADDIFAFLNEWFAFGPGLPCP